MAPKESQQPQNWVNGFRRRWNIDLSEDQRWEDFRNRALNAYDRCLSNCFYDALEQNEFFDIVGIHRKPATVIYSPPDVYEYISKKELGTSRFIFCLEAFFRMEYLEEGAKTCFLPELQKAIADSGAPLAITHTGTEVLFYPAGAKLLDERLVNDNLHWLTQFPESYKPFAAALGYVGVKSKERAVLDNLRLSLETLLKALLNNNKSLENQQADLGAFLKAKGTSTEISNTFWKLLDLYAKYQNTHAKHGDSAKPEEVEFILYQTGTLMRFLITRP